MHALGDNLLPEIGHLRFGLTERCLFDGGHGGWVGGENDRHLEVENRLFAGLKQPGVAHNACGHGGVGLNFGWFAQVLQVDSEVIQTEAACGVTGRKGVKQAAIAKKAVSVKGVYPIRAEGLVQSR